MKKMIRIILILAGIILFLIFLTPYMSNKTLNIGNVTGGVLSLGVMVYGIFYNCINEAVKEIFKNICGKIFIFVLAGMTVIILSLVVIETAFMVKACMNTPNGETTVIVLGCKVNGEKPSLMLRERLDAAYEYLLENESIKCILSGGKGNDEDISEAECMYRYLTKKGIDKSRLYIEEKSTSTRENLLFSKEIIEKEGLAEDITIVTNEFHQYRAGQVAKSLGLNFSAISGGTKWYLLPTFYIRELYGILYQWVF